MYNFRLRRPCRNQMEMKIGCLDDLIPEEHRARDIWRFVEKMDTSPCFNTIKSVYRRAGRPTTSPKVLLALWIYSILDGNLSARKLEELCLNHNVYKWIAGGTPINRTMLAEFCSINPIKFEDLLTNCLAVMVEAGVLTGKDFGQDGTRIKANAGFSSFRTKETLKKIKAEVQEHIRELREEVAKDSDVYKTKKLCMAQEKNQQIEKALKNLEQFKKEKVENGKKNHKIPKEEDLEKMRASMTEPEVRKMKMGDGGYRLAYNIQFATEMDSRVIFGADVVNTLDPGTSPKMMCRVHSRLKKLNLAPAKNWVADAAYSGKKDIEEVANLFPDCCYYAPPKPCKGIDPKKELKNDSEAVKKWRRMIDTEEVNEVYKNRCSTTEFSNMQVKNRGLREFLVRGLGKVKGIVNLHALTQNISRYINLCSKKTAEELA